jgi:hypothetical protein
MTSHLVDQTTQNLCYYSCPFSGRCYSSTAAHDPLIDCLRHFTPPFWAAHTWAAGRAITTTRHSKTWPWYDIESFTSRLNILFPNNETRTKIEAEHDIVDLILALVGGPHPDSLKERTPWLPGTVGNQKTVTPTKASTGAVDGEWNLLLLHTSTQP